ncbi:hypothetical protein CAOG_06091 [Capsaspora owczarzaki ATCC 30864]|uniref:5-hydroxyisourate hydrolase n=1 Tax=Capsaspora owczarzaki (strain ATCC 30864) TaxID=595528 RepID=A0A0D2X494_CAPO3|nr:hypothetical protein CAOG_06091 [Capsaspora owczarzaki ATCC 30864]KJE95664.1 hypothetical protein CAOG_006091 [Capsaspora owczarzaki ATCC 30864]|eukprot:XP_004345681.1 hypothetical protein CAOG_06091 [Capsaspora owczarzaki ATCC 30864]
MQRAAVLCNHLALNTPFRLESPESAAAAAVTMSAAGPLTTHILDTTLGRPAANVPLRLERASAVPSSPSLASVGSETWEVLATGVTNQDGRCPGLLSGRITPGRYRMTFDTNSYFASTNTEGFYPYVQIVFSISDTTSHYHIPLLLSPYGYSTYRGS